MAEKTIVTLASQKDWDEWIEVVKTMAIASDIWSFVNPDTPKASLPTLEEPAALKPEDVNAQKTTFSALDEDEKEELRELRRERKRKLDKYDRRRQGLATLRASIQTTVTRANLSYTFNCETVHDMLVTLQKRFNPTDETREREVIQRYQKLKEPPRNQAMEPWLQNWEKTYDDCRRLDLPDTNRNRAVRDFIYTVDYLEPGFTSYWRIRLIEDPKSDIDLHGIIQKFREYQTESPERRSASHSAFQATLQGRGINHKECVCGENHHFKDCPYLIKAKRTPGWKPDQEVQDKIDEKIRTSERLKGIVERLRKEADDAPKMPSVF